MSAETALGVALVVPWLCALLALALGKRPNLREAATLLGAGVTLASVIAAGPEVLRGGRPGFSTFSIVPGLDLAFELEPLGWIFALLASGLWIVTTAYSIGYLRSHHEENQSRFFACFALAIAAALGVAASSNLLTLYVFYEVLTLTTYPLVAHHGTPEAKRGARVYLSLLLGTSLLLLVALLWTWQIAGTLDFEPGGILAGKIAPTAAGVLLGLFAFGCGKAALMPFHRWLPAAMVAPTPVSALLHAVAVVKAGVFSILKVVIYIFGLDLLASGGSSRWLTWAAAATLLLASLVAMFQDNLKRRLAYSTVSQLAYVVLGAALANSWGWLGGALHVVMHAFGKITLFFCAGAYYITAHKTRVSELAGIGRRMPWTTAAFLVGALSVAGIPPLGGAWSKWYLTLGAAEAGQPWLVAVLMVSTLLNIGYLVPIAARGFFLPEPAALQAASDHGEAPLWCVVPLCLTAAACVLLFFLVSGLRSILLAPLGL